MSPVKKVWRPTPSGKAEGNIGREADSTGVVEQGTRALGFPGSWEISSTLTSSGTAERATASRQEVDEKSERLGSSDDFGEPVRRDPIERSEAPEQGTVWRKDGRDVVLGNCLNEN